jgi:hypothetical protein
MRQGGAVGREVGASKQRGLYYLVVGAAMEGMGMQQQALQKRPGQQAPQQQEVQELWLPCLAAVVVVVA